MFSLLAIVALSAPAHAQGCYSTPSSSWFGHTPLRTFDPVPNAPDLQHLGIAEDGLAFVPQYNYEVYQGGYSLAPTTAGSTSLVASEDDITSMDRGSSHAAGHDLIAWTVSYDDHVRISDTHGNVHQVHSVHRPTDVAFDTRGWGMLVWSDDNGIWGCEDATNCQPTHIAVPGPSDVLVRPRVTRIEDRRWVVFDNDATGEVGLSDLAWGGWWGPLLSGSNPDIDGDTIVFEDDANNGCSYAGQTSNHIWSFDLWTGNHTRLIDQPYWSAITAGRPRISSTHVTFQADWFATTKRALLTIPRSQIGSVSAVPKEVTDDLSDTFWNSTPVSEDSQGHVCAIYRTRPQLTLQDGDGVLTCFHY